MVLKWNKFTIGRGYNGKSGFHCRCWISQPAGPRDRTPGRWIGCRSVGVPAAPGAAFFGCPFSGVVIWLGYG